MVGFPYYSHIFRDSKMGVGLGKLVWVPLTIGGGPMSLKVPENPIDHTIPTLQGSLVGVGSQYLHLCTTKLMKNAGFFCRPKNMGPITTTKLG